MKISWIKYNKDENSFKIPERLGFKVLKVEDLEETDKILHQLIKQQYNTIIITSEIASSSQDIIKKYNKSENVNIVIAKGND